MSQDFNNMSDIYIPELMELDSYWRKAVEDAIYDTLKGERRVYYALKNRKKIKQKLVKYGVEPIRRPRLSDESERWDKDISRSPCRCSWRSDKKSSGPSLDEDTDQDSPLSVPKETGSHRAGSRSKSRGPSKEKRGPDQNPDSPFLGDGSHEKIKKSQNSFNYEAMGSRSSLAFGKDKNLKVRKSLDGDVKIECLHVTEDGAFRDSDTEMSINDTCKEVEKKENEKYLTAKQMNYFIRNKNKLSSSTAAKPECEANKKIPDEFDLQEDLFWENEVKKAIKENAGLEQKLCLALAKRQILSRGTRRTNNKIQIPKCPSETRYRRKKLKQLLSPFVKFYLEVYRELCRKRPVAEIAPEAVARWRAMAAKQKKGRPLNPKVLNN